MKSPTLTRLLPAVLAGGLLAAAPVAQERDPAPAPSASRAQRGVEDRVETPAERPAPAARPVRGSSGLPEVSDLAGVRGAFAQRDLDHNGSINFAEATRSGISRPMFSAFDMDSNGSIERDEFTVSYHQLLADTRRPVGRDLDAEAARLRALHNQRREEAQKQRVQNARHEAAIRDARTDEAGRTRLVPAPDGPAPQRVPTARAEATTDTVQRRERRARYEAAARKTQHEHEYQARKQTAAQKAQHEHEYQARKNEAAAQKAMHERTNKARHEAAAQKAQNERIQNARHDQYGGQRGHAEARGQHARGTDASQRDAGKARQPRPSQQGARGQKPPQHRPQSKPEHKPEHDRQRP